MYQRKCYVLQKEILGTHTELLIGSKQKVIPTGPTLAKSCTRFQNPTGFPDFSDFLTIYCYYKPLLLTIEL